MDELPLVLNMKDIAKIMRVSLPKAYEIARREGFPAVRDGNRVFIPRDAFLEWLNPNRNNEAGNQSIGKIDFVYGALQQDMSITVTLDSRAQQAIVGACVQAVLRSLATGNIQIDE